MMARPNSHTGEILLAEFLLPLDISPNALSRAAGRDPIAAWMKLMEVVEILCPRWPTRPPSRASRCSLTEVLPVELRELLARLDPKQVPTIALSLNEAPSSLMSWACALTRGFVGLVRAFLAGLRMPRGFLANNAGGRVVTEHAAPAAGSLLRWQLLDQPVHEDTFTLELPAAEVGTTSSAALLEAVLDGFLQNRPLAVSRMMAFRNVLVKPLGLRTSPLGCPVSSLLTDKSRSQLFAGRFPVLQARESRDGTCAEVILGADDKHLKFRSCVGVVRHTDGSATVSLGTRVRTSNWFGWVYMLLIDRTHKRYVSPTMLRLAVDFAVRRLRAD